MICLHLASDHCTEASKGLQTQHVVYSGNDWHACYIHVLFNITCSLLLGVKYVKVIEMYVQVIARLHLFI